MSALSNVRQVKMLPSASTPQPQTTDAIASTGEPVWAPNTAAQRRRTLVYVLRALVLVVWLGGWELTTRLGWIDSFFFSRPSAIWQQIVTWATNGTAQGPLWDQIAA